MFPKIVGFPSKSSILIGCSIINRQFWGTLIFGNTHIDVKLIFGFRINVESEAIGILCGSELNLSECAHGSAVSTADIEGFMTFDAAQTLRLKDVPQEFHVLEVL